jgi:hypothetical protein
VTLHLLIEEEQTILRKNTLSVLSGNIETTDDTNKGVSIIVIDKVKPGYSPYGRILVQEMRLTKFFNPPRIL